MSKNVQFLIICTINTDFYIKNHLTAKIYAAKMLSGAGVPIQEWGLKDDQDKQIIHRE